MNQSPTFRRGIFRICIFLSVLFWGCTKEKDAETPNTTGGNGAPNLVIDSVQILDAYVVAVHISIVSDSGNTVTKRGLVYGEDEANGTPSLENGIDVTDTASSSSFSIILVRFSSGFTYYVRAYATNAKGTTYSEVRAIPAISTLLTTNVDSIGAGSAKSGGSITATSPLIKMQGVAWSQNHSPSIFGDYSINGSGGGNYTSTLTNLTGGVTYYVRAYYYYVRSATEDSGYVYGDERSFIAGSATPQLPTVTTDDAQSVLSKTAMLIGNVVSDGGSPITQTGFVFSKSPNPDTTDTIYTTTTLSGTFTKSISGLTPLTTYYVKAFAKNSVGTAYGSEKSFSTFILTGDAINGGIYVSESGLTFIVATSDQSAAAPWGCSGTSISTSTTNGIQNTLNIVNGCATSGIAARLCNDLVQNGKNDWYLPTVQQLDIMEDKKSIIGGFTTSAGYWSSEETSSLNTSAVYVDFGPGGHLNLGKNLTNRVRAVRPYP